MVSAKLILSYLALSSVTTAAPPPNNTDLYYADITTIDTNVKKLTAKAKSYQGGLIWVVPQIPLALQAAVATANAGVHSSRMPNPLPVEDLLRLTEHVNKTLAVDNPIAVDTFIAKKALYEETGLKLAIHLSLKVFMALQLRVADNILARVPSDAPKDKVEVAKRDIQIITEALQRGIDAYA